MSAIFVTLDWISASFRRRIANQRLEGDCHCGFHFKTAGDVGLALMTSSQDGGAEITFFCDRCADLPRAELEERLGVVEAITPRREKFAQGVMFEISLAKACDLDPAQWVEGWGEAAQRA
jgi:hypothetical protein